MMESANGKTKTVTVKPANTKADPTVVKAAGGQISGVVRRDGTVRLWGSVLGGVTTPPAGLAGVHGGSVWLDGV